MSKPEVVALRSAKGGYVALRVFARAGDWAITQVARAGLVKPHLGLHEITYLGEGEHYGARVFQLFDFAGGKVANMRAGLSALKSWTSTELLAYVKQTGQRNVLERMRAGDLSDFKRSA